MLKGVMIDSESLLLDSQEIPLNRVRQEVVEASDRIPQKRTEPESLTFKAPSKWQFQRRRIVNLPKAVMRKNQIELQPNQSRPKRKNTTLGRALSATKISVEDKST